MSGVIDLWYVYQFIKRLATPFEEWDAYKTGVIDEDGNILKRSKERRMVAERDSFTKFDLLVLKLKKLMEKIPGGKSKLASYAASLWFIKEHNENGRTVVELLEEDDIIIENILTDWMPILEDVRINLEAETLLEEMSAGSGAVAGIGIGVDGEPGVHMKKRKKQQDRLFRRFKEAVDKL